MQTILKSHNTKTNRAMFKVGVACFLNGVIININHIVKHSHRGGNGALQFIVIQPGIWGQMRSKVY